MEQEQQKKVLTQFWKENIEPTEEALKAFNEVDRKNFVPESIRNLAYEDAPLPLLRGKTISQPTTVMIMTTALELKEGQKVFEIGTGSGYQAAIIAKITGEKGKVITTEVIPELVTFARQNLQKAGITNAKVYEEDGSKGLKEEAPFDRVIITAACKEIPKPVLEQLKPEGVVVAPIGNAQEQSLVKGTKDKNGRLQIEVIGPFVFTPMYGKYGFET